MNKLLYLVLILGGFAVLLGVGRIWNLRPETKYDHELHTGEIAVANSKTGSQVWMAVDQKDCYATAVAMSKNDTAYLNAATANQSTFVVPVGTLVQVLGQTESRVHVKVTEGTATGKQGWAEFEFVRPRKAGEFR